MSRWLLIVLTALSLAGCSAMQLGYNNVDKLVNYQLNDWFGLSGELNTLSKERVARVIAWHRREELPEYARMLQTIRARLDQPEPMTAQEVEALQQQASKRLLRVGNELADQYSEVIAQMGPAQRKHLLAKMDDSNNDYRSKHIDIRPAKLRAHRIDATTDRYEFWLGKLDAAQQASIEQWVDGLDIDSHANLAERERRQQVFLGIFDAARSAPPADTSRQLRAFFAEFDAPTQPAARERQRAMFARWARLTADILNEASPEQRKHAKDRLQKMSDDLSTLSRQQKS